MTTATLVTRAAAVARAWLAPQRAARFVVAHVVLSALALALALIPLLNVLGYEFSLVVAIASSIAIGPVAFRSLDAGLAAAGSSMPLDPGGLFVRLLSQHLFLLVGPLLVILLNAIRVPNCDVTGGIAAYVLFPGVSVAWATLAAMVAWGLSRGRRWLRGVIFGAFFIVSVAGTLAHLALEPPIVAVNPWFGYFAGSLYDEALAAPVPLLVYRSLQVLLICGLVLALDLAAKRGRSEPMSRGALALTGSLFAIVLVAHANHAAIGYSLDRDDIIAALGGRTETEHFVIYHAASGEWPEKMAAIADDHEFRYWQLHRFFGTTPEGKIESFVYPDSETKGRLMGARRTLVAKLWLGEIHITYGGYGNSVLAHELAHVFTAPYGTGPLDLSTTWGIFPNMGLVEGIAVAAEWGGREFTPHGWAAAMHRLELAPDLEAILGAGGFWSAHNRTVYTLMGSFVRWLVVTRGIEKLGRAYGHGDFEGAYGVPLGELAEEWRTFLGTIELTDRDLALASFYFDRPSIFGKRCARNLATRIAEAKLLEQRGKIDESVSVLREVVALDPSNPDYKFLLMATLARAEDYADALMIGDDLLELDGLGAVRRAQVTREIGDVRWRQGDHAGALETYASLADAGALPPDDQRALRARVVAVADPSVRDTIEVYFFGGLSAQRQLALLYEAQARLDRPHPMLDYLLGIRLQGAGDREPAGRRMSQALRRGLEGDELVEKARFILGEALYFEGELAAADALFAALEDVASLEGFRASATEWRERIRWKRSNSIGKDASLRIPPSTLPSAVLADDASAGGTHAHDLVGWNAAASEHSCSIRH